MELALHWKILFFCALELDEGNLPYRLIKENSELSLCFCEALSKNFLRQFKSKTKSNTAGAKRKTHEKTDKNTDAKRATYLFFLWLHHSETAAPSAPVTMGTSASAPRKQIGPPPR